MIGVILILALVVPVVVLLGIRCITDGLAQRRRDLD